MKSKTKFIYRYVLGKKKVLRVNKYKGYGGSKYKNEIKNIFN